MTINEFIESLRGYNLLMLVIFIAIPVTTYFYGKVMTREEGEQSPYKYVYSVLVYLAAVPGMFSGVLTAYALFILKANLLEVNVVVYYVPIISMIATVLLLRKNVDLDKVPGFDRLIGLFIVLGATFAITLMILQTRIWLVFHSKFLSFIIIAVALFLLLSFGMNKLTSSGGEKSENGEEPGT